MDRPRIIFAYREGHRSSGAKIMRVDQLSAMAQSHLGERWDFETLALPRPGRRKHQRELTDDIRGAVVIFLKRAFEVVDLDVQWEWRDAARALAVDYVDAETAPWPKIPIDVHIAASGALKTHLLARLDAHPELARSANTRVMRLDHHADPSLNSFWPDRPSDELRLFYFGRPKNRTLPKSLADRVVHPEYGGLGIGDEHRGVLATANMHYAVRDMPPPDKRSAFKPFTKGFTAAACGAHILVNRQADDAEDFLGADYPFLIEDCTKDAIRGAIDLAHSMVGTPKWSDSLSVMESIRASVEPKKIMAQLEAILVAASG
ncbi:MAG: hypothetical protein ACR2OY_13850 [Boseongicola sp.]